MAVVRFSSISNKYVVPHRRPPCKTLCIMKPEIVVSSPSDGPRVFVMSYLHINLAENMARIKCLSTVDYKQDVLLLAGDVSETQQLHIQKGRFEHVFYVPGNYNLWCRWKEDKYLDSIEKMNKLLAACGGPGVKTNPKIIGDLEIIPMLSWYHGSFDREKDIWLNSKVEKICRENAIGARYGHQPRRQFYGSSSEFVWCTWNLIFLLFFAYGMG